MNLNKILKLRNKYYFLQSTLKVIRHTPLYRASPIFKRENDIEKASEYIYNLLITGKPCLIARYGDYELSKIVHYLGYSDPQKSVWKYLTGRIPQYWWDKEQYIHHNIPVNEDFLVRYAQINLEDTKIVDVLGSWKPEEFWLYKYGYFNPNIFTTNLLALEPYHSLNPWSRYLKGKRVLLIHLFVKTIKDQYLNHRTELFQNPDVLPEFKSLRIIKSIMMGSPEDNTKDWFKTLDYYKAEMDKEPYDVAIISCSSPGFCLGAHAKRTGHQAIVLGGATQLLFGVRGKRWDNPLYGIQEFGVKDTYQKLFNPKWIYPHKEDIPNELKNIEGGCYIGNK